MTEPIRIYATVPSFRKYGHTFTRHPVLAVVTEDGVIPDGCPAQLALTPEQAGRLFLDAATPNYPLQVDRPSEVDLEIAETAHAAGAVTRQRDAELRALEEARQQREEAERAIRDQQAMLEAVTRQLQEAQDKQRRAEEMAARAEERIAAAEAKRAELEEQESHPRKKPR